MLLRRKQLLISLCLASFWTLCLHLIGSDHHTFDEKWKDNVSNISSAFLVKDFQHQIYTSPTKNLVNKIDPEKTAPFFSNNYFSCRDCFFEHKGHPLYLVWANVPRPYPIGAWLVYGPFAGLFYGLGWSLSQTTLILGFVFFITAHISFFMFFNIFRSQLPSEKNYWLKGFEIFIIGLCYYEFVRWSGQGQYDLFGMLFLIPCFYYLKLNNYPKVIFFYGLSLFFHFRSLLMLGPIFIVLYKMITTSERSNSLLSRDRIFENLLAIILGLIAASIFFLNLKYINADIYTNNKYSLAFISKLPVLKIIYYVLTTWVFALVLIYLRLYLIGATALGINLAMIFSPLVRGWYVLYFFPIFLLLDKNSKIFKRDIALVTACYIFLASSYPNQNPFDFTFFKELFQLIKQRIS